MIRIDDFGPVPNDPRTSVSLRSNVGLARLSEFSFSRFREGIPKEQTLIRVRTESESLYTLWFVTEGSDGSVVVVVQSEHQPCFREHRVVFYERLSHDRKRRLNPSGFIQSGNCLSFLFVDAQGNEGRITTSRVQSEGIELFIGADATLFERALRVHQMLPLSNNSAQGDTVWSELLSLAPDEARVVNQVVRLFSAEVQVRLRRILGMAAANGRLRPVTDKLLYCHDRLWSQTGYDKCLSDSIFATLERMASR
ncbi:MAG: hypothetical protein E6P95_03465 [Candidatus Moraniibacteriota bacterium]|nr:MAG: hypothetical protein E6P95_03465 [Candidatus Moranbacteria bacterium]